MHSPAVLPASPTPTDDALVSANSRAAFEALPEGTRAELFQSQVIMAPAPEIFHQDIELTLTLLLAKHIRTHKLGKCWTSPIDVELAPDTVVQPDLVFVAQERLGIVGTKRIVGAPDLVIEILSPSTATHDLVRKRAAYQLAGVRHYWIVSPEERSLTILTLNAQHVYELSHTLQEADTFAPELFPGLTFEVKQIFEN
jgi:Uma2 family endonuclease